MTETGEPIFVKSIYTTGKSKCRLCKEPITDTDSVVFPTGTWAPLKYHYACLDKWMKENRPNGDK